MAVVTDEASCRRHALRVSVVMQLTPALAAGAEWSRAGTPTLLAGAALDYLVARARCPAGMLLDWSRSSALECDGNWEEAMGVLAGRDPLGETLAHLEAAFLQHVAPLDQAYRTRTKDWTKWRSVVTWGAARRCLPLLLPMSVRVVRCLVWDALGANCSYSVIKALVDAIQTRHRRLGLPQPVSGRGAYAALMRSLQRFQGQQARLFYPIHKDVVRRALQRVHLARALFPMSLGRNPNVFDLCRRTTPKAFTDMVVSTAYLMDLGWGG
jgi:hypothetical protein